jgi:hypothetical protein
MRSDTIVAIGATLASLLTAAGGVWVAIRKEGRDGATTSKARTRALEQAWLWALRTIVRLRSLIARTEGLSEPPEWRIDEEMSQHERRISGESEESKT